MCARLGGGRRGVLEKCAPTRTPPCVSRSRCQAQITSREAAGASRSCRASMCVFSCHLRRAQTADERGTPLPIYQPLVSEADTDDDGATGTLTATHRPIRDLLIASVSADVFAQGCDQRPLKKLRPKYPVSRAACGRRAFGLRGSSLLSGTFRARRQEEASERPLQCRNGDGRASPDAARPVARASAG